MRYVILLISLLLSPVNAANARYRIGDGSVTGRYAGKATDSVFGTTDLTLQITETTGHVTGTVSTEFGGGKIANGEYREGQLTLTFDVGGTSIHLSAHRSGPLLVGSYSAGDNRGTFTLRLISIDPDFIPDRLRTLTRAQWREDVKFFADELEKRHKNVFHHVSRAEYRKTVNRLLRAIPHLSYSEIIVEMDRITAKVGDAHTYVHLPAIFHRYPLSLYWFGDECRVLRTTVSYRRTLGSRLISIDGCPILTVRRRIHAVFSQDETDWLLRSASPGLMMVPEILQSLHVVRDITHAKFLFQTDSGERFAITVRAGNANDKPDQTILHSMPPGFQEVAEPFPIRSLDEGKEVYVNFTGYDNLQANSKKLFDLVDTKPLQKLIIDLRQNSGGDFLIGRQYLIDGIKKRPAINRKGHLFVIIGRATFSAAMANAADFHRETNAILVGEPVGEKPNSFQERRLLTLPVSVNWFL